MIFIILKRIKMYENCLKGTYRAMVVKSWGFNLVKK